ERPYRDLSRQRVHRRFSPETQTRNRAERRRLERGRCRHRPRRQDGQNRRRQGIRFERRAGHPHPHRGEGRSRGVTESSSTNRSTTNMNRTCLILGLLFAFAIRPAGVFAANASGPTPQLKAPALEDRVADLEAYVNNAARLNAANTNLDTRIGGPGPGHNAFQMVCAALVLFMTLPGLALFYGGLVRRKNVLSVLAQCLGIAGLVTILWWLVGYSLVFSRGSPFIGGLQFAFLGGVDGRPNG